MPVENMDHIKISLPEVSDTADEEEFRLIRAIVCSIVKEYNQLRKQLKMTYNENEINDGIPRLR